MDFFIKQKSNLPILKMELINDGRYDFGNFYDDLQNSEITFTMYDADTEIKVIGGKTALCVLKEDSDNEYYIGYKFSDRETRKKGTYKGYFTIKFNDTSEKLIVPIKDDLNIHIK